MIAVGILVSLIGLCVLPAAFGDRGESNLLGVAGTLFGMGALAAASGFFLNGQALKSKASGGAPEKAAKQNRRGACDLCREETPVVNCKVHQFHLCGKCLAEHYDFRSCVYVPSTRRIESKSEKAMAAKASRS